MDVSEDEDNQDSFVEDLGDRISGLTEQLGLSHDTDSSFVSSGDIGLQHSDSFQIHDSLCFWRKYYPVLTFLISGHLFADYERLSGLPGLHACSNSQWNKRLDEHVTNLAEWSCGQV